MSLDIIRGLALFGILFINIPAYQDIIVGKTVIPSHSEIDKIIENFTAIFIEKNSFQSFHFYLG